MSAVIPARNAVAHVGEAVASALAQTHSAVEVLVVDDGSTDGTAEVAERAGARCVRLARSVGGAAARNVGVGEVSTDLVAFLDHDDLWTPDHLATLVPLLARTPDAALAYGQMRSFGAASTQLDRPGADGAPFDAGDLLLAWNFVPQSGAVVRRAAFHEAGGYDPRLRHAEDYDLWLRLAERHRFVGSARVTTLYRVHPGQLSGDVTGMVAGEWTARGRHADRIAAVDAARGAAVRRRLRRVWQAELRQAWRERNTALFAARLAAAPQVPGSARSARVWALAARWVGPAWLPTGGGARR